MPLSLARPNDRSRFGTGLVLRAVTWLFCLALIAIGWLAALQQIRFEREQAVNDAIAQNVNRAIAFEQYVRRTLEVAAISTRYVADRFQRGAPGPEFGGTPDRPAMMAGNFARGNSTFVAVTITDARGDVIASSRPASGRQNVSAYSAFQVHVARDSGQLYVSPPFRLPALGRDVILLSRRLNHPDGSFAGVVALTILPEQFTNFYRDAQVGPRDVMSLVGFDGITRARRTGPVSSSGEDLRGTIAMRLVEENPNGSDLAVSPLDGVARFYSRRLVSGYPLWVSHGVLESEVMAAPRRRARVLIAAVALGSLAILAFATVLTLLVNRGERRGREMIAANARLEEAQRIGEMGDWHYNIKTRDTYWSPQVYALHERDPALGPIPREEFRAMLDEPSLAALDQAVAAAFKTQETQVFELKATLPSGVETYFHVVGIPLLDGAGKVTGLRGTIQNISEHKQLELLQTRVAHLSRIDAMNAMATTLAHELNQPLTAAANYLAGSRRVLTRAEACPTGAEDGLIAAEQQVHFAAGIIRRLREMVANQPRRLTDFSAESVIADSLALIATGVGAPQPPIVQRLDPAAPNIHADRVQVQQVIINLLRNAIEALRGRAMPEIALYAESWDGGMVRLSVADNGPGFSQPEAQRFSPFANDGSGMGLGLSISRTIVESYGGRIWTEDRPGGGAMVHFTLPAASGEAAAAA